MAVLRGDVVIPELFQEYIVEQTTLRDDLLSSGVVMPMEELNITAMGGDFVNLPFWKANLTGDFEVMTESTQLTPDKITADKQIAVVLHRARAYEERDLAGLAAGSDPMAAIGMKVADYVANQRQKDLLACLQGVFGTVHSTSNSAAFFDLTVDGATGDTPSSLSPSTVARVKNKLGDHGDKLTAMCIHSSVYYDLLERRSLDFVLDDSAQKDSDASQGSITPAFMPGISRIPYFCDLRVVVSDDVNKNGSGSSTEYAAYFFTEGAIAAGTQMGFRLETDRDIMAKADAMSFDLHYIYHPIGSSWTAGTTVNPTRAQLRTVGNWEKVYDTKNIGIARATVTSDVD